MAGELVELIRSRIDADFDGECHLTKDEALSIIGLIDHLRDNSRIEALERENATLRAERDEARKVLEPFAQAAWVVRYTERLQAREFGDDQPFQSGLAWQKDGVTRTITYGDLRRAAAIRNMGGGENG